MRQRESHFKLTLITCLVRSYSVNGEILSETFIDPYVSQDCYTTNYLYDGWGKPTAMGYPVSDVVATFINSHGWQDQILLWDYSDDENSVHSLVSYIAYDFEGDIKEMQYNNGMKVSLPTDNRNRVDWIKVERSLDIYYNLDYQHDVMDQITHIGNRHYVYNPDGTLRYVEGGPEGRVDFSYDGCGNLYQMTPPVPGHFDIGSISFNSNNRINGYDYDANGNLLCDPVTGNNYLYDVENRLIWVTNHEDVDLEYFAYDGENHRRVRYSGNEYELYFYDLTGNNLVEKVSFNADTHRVKDDKCFVNAGNTNVAQFNYYTPTPTPVPEVQITLNDHTEEQTFYPNSVINGDLYFDYTGRPMDANLYILLYVNGSYYFGDSWQTEIAPYSQHLEPGMNQHVGFLNLPLPDSLPDMNDLAFCAFFTTPDETLFGNISFITFSLSSGVPFSYVEPGIPGEEDNGTLNHPYHSIQTAIDNAQPTPGNPIVVKLMPGVYTITGANGTIALKEWVNLIGSGQSRTFINGEQLENSIVCASNSTVQGFTSRVNIICGGTSPVIRNIRMINNNAACGVGCFSNANPHIINCLISGYTGDEGNGSGIFLQESSAVIENCTIVDNSYGLYFDYDLHPYPACNCQIINSIFAGNQMGISLLEGGNLQMDISYSDFYNSAEFENTPNVIGQSGNIGVNPRFTQGPDSDPAHSCYLSNIDAGQSMNSPCINRGSPSISSTMLIGGTTRNDSVVDQCRSDMGYHYPHFVTVIGQSNINNDSYSSGNPLSVLSDGPKDLVVIDDQMDVNTFFEDNCSLKKQPKPVDDDVITATTGDLSGDGLDDIAVSKESGTIYFINNGIGQFTEQKDAPGLDIVARSIRIADLDHDGLLDQVIASSQGTLVRIHVSSMGYKDLRMLASGKTDAVGVGDLNGDSHPDLVTISEEGTIRVYLNSLPGGFIEMETGLRIGRHRDVRIVDRDNDGMKDIEIEVMPEVSFVFWNQRDFNLNQLSPDSPYSKLTGILTTRP